MMKKLNQKLAKENAIITQAGKDPCSLQAKADYQLNQPKKSIQERKLYLMRQLNQKLAIENATIMQADKDPCSQQTKADYQLNQS